MTKSMALIQNLSICIQPRDGGAGVLLYVGFILTVIGLILTVLGAGEDGFKSAELSLIGPSLMGMGVFFALLRVLTCTCHEKCARLCPRLCPPPSNQQNTLLQPVQTQPTTVASAEDPQDTRVLLSPPVAHTPSPVVEGAEAAAVQVDLGVVTKVRFENEIKNENTSLDIDLSEFEEVELNSPVSSRGRRKVKEPVDIGELVLNPSKLVS